MTAQQEPRPERDRERSPDGIEALDLSTLVDDHEAFEERLGQPTPIAVTGQPFAGRGVVLEYAAEVLGCERRQFVPGADPEWLVDRLGEEPVVVDNCQHLFDRAVGGFDRLERVTNAVARAEEPVVTGWNQFAWTYLDAVRDVGNTYDRFELAALGRQEIETVVQEQRGTLPTFESEQLDESLLETVTLSLDWRDLELDLPIPDTAALKRRFEPASDPKDVTFSRLAALSNGNPGVALALWDRCFTGDAHCAADIELPTVDIDREGAFLLWLVLANETVEREQLEEWFGSRVDQLLGVLDRREIVAEEGGQVGIQPAGVPTAVSSIETERIL